MVIGVPCVKRGEQVSQLVAGLAALRHVRSAQRTSHYAIEIEALRIGKRQAFGGREPAARGDDARIECHPLSGGLTSDVEDRLTIPGRERIGRASAVPDEREPTVRFQDARELRECVGWTK